MPHIFGKWPSPYVGSGLPLKEISIKDDPGEYLGEYAVESAQEETGGDGQYDDDHRKPCCLFPAGPDRLAEFPVSFLEELYRVDTPAAGGRDDALAAR